jgi:hypothetical protein
MPKKKHMNSGPQEDQPSEGEMSAYTMLKMRQQAIEWFDAGFLILTKTIDGHTSMFHTKFGNEFALRGLIESYMDEHINPCFQEPSDPSCGDDQEAECN